MRTLVVPVVFCLCLMACQSGPGPGVALSPAATSTEALQRVLDGLEAKDTKAVVALVDGGAAAQDFFASMVETFLVVEEFEKKFRESYGAEAWEAFQAALPPGDGRPDMNLEMADFPALRKAAATWEANQENGGVFTGLVRAPLPFKEVDGGWVVDGANMFPDEETLVGMTDTQRKVTVFIQSFMKAVGHRGISAEDIDYQMGKDLMIMLMGGDPQVGGKTVHPDRFKLEEL